MTRATSAAPSIASVRQAGLEALLLKRLRELRAEGWSRYPVARACHLLGGTWQSECERIVDALAARGAITLDFDRVVVIDLSELGVSE